jgi:hypothetical protein
MPVDMNNHSSIIKRIGAANAAKLTGATIYAVRAWIQRDSIPAEQWAALIEAGHCSADELIAAADKRKAA